MRIVAGLSLKNLQPRVWDPESPYYLSDLTAVMVSYADFHRLPAMRRAAMKQGLRKFLGAPDHVDIYLDNGAFFFATHDDVTSFADYDKFVRKTQPDWKPVPQDYIPFPTMSRQRQFACFKRTMAVNEKYRTNGYVPVLHVGRYLTRFTESVEANPQLSAKPSLALGAIVPHLLRKKDALPYGDVLDGLLQVRNSFADQSIHVFGVGGTATLHLMALIGFDSVDSSGWRNRAARGIIQLAGSGERVVSNLGNWRGKSPSRDERRRLEKCRCPACQIEGLSGLRQDGLSGFCNRATHNLWVLLWEREWLEEHIRRGTYATNYRYRLKNSIYRPLVNKLLRKMRQTELAKGGPLK